MSHTPARQARRTRTLTLQQTTIMTIPPPTTRMTTAGVRGKPKMTDASRGRAVHVQGGQVDGERGGGSIPRACSAAEPSRKVDRRERCQRASGASVRAAVHRMSHADLRPVTETVRRPITFDRMTTHRSFREENTGLLHESSSAQSVSTDAVPGRFRFVLGHAFLVEDRDVHQLPRERPPDVRGCAEPHRRARRRRPSPSLVPHRPRPVSSVRASADVRAWLGAGRRAREGEAIPLSRIADLGALRALVGDIPFCRSLLMLQAAG